MAFRLGVDVGGTFTDLVLFEPDSGAVELTKTSSTPADQAVGVEEGIRRVSRRRGIEPCQIGYLVHGTTVATNALLERRGVRCALLVTEGFRDVLPVGRQDRPRLYDWTVQRPAPLVPRRRCFEVRERLLHTGEVLTPLDEPRAVETIRAARAAGVEALAICLLHAYANPAHERRLRDLVAEHFPEAHVSISSDVLPEFKEYERMSTTVANAYVMPIVGRYLSSLAERVRGLGMDADLHIMQSNGGVMTARAAATNSVRTILSGPAAGALGAVSLARQAGYANALTVDMGGTSFDICLAHQGQLRFTKESEVGGLPIKVPMIDIHTLGAGGGSVAWIDTGGALRVGPRSAGAAPGPACYGRGGAEPTVTDANLVLGRLGPDSFLGGEMRLDPAAARRAVADVIAAPLGLGIDQAAEGVVRVVNATMVRGMRAVSVEKGYDPRELLLVAFGGGGPLHAVELARELGAREVLVPLAPGVTSALGLLLADVRYDVSATFLGSLGAPESTALTGLYRELERLALEQTGRDGIAPDEVTLLRTAEVRYRHQGFELEVPVPPDELGAAALDRVRQAFDQLHARHYGYTMPNADVILVNAQVTAVARLPRPEPRPERSGPANAAAAISGRRRAYVGGRWVQASVYDRARLRPGACLTGPAIVEQPDSTTLLFPDDQGRIDPFGNLIISVAA